MDRVDGSERFIELARQYCSWVEGPPMEPEYGVKSALRLLSSLYAECVQLPDIEPAKRVTPDEVKDGQRERINARFASLPIDVYHDCGDPLTKPVPATNSLADDLTAIYWDIKPGLAMVEDDKPDAAVRHWLDSFHAHWGWRAVMVLRVLHHYADEHGLWAPAE
jgi:hypothetical protein